jgi:hypothetical protein
MAGQELLDVPPVPGPLDIAGSNLCEAEEVGRCEWATELRSRPRPVKGSCVIPLHDGEKSVVAVFVRLPDD